MRVVFTELDNTLLDYSYSFEPALGALERLRQLDIPVIFVTSKTFSEVDVWRRAMNNVSPFIVENGAAIFSPKGSLPLPPSQTESRGEYDIGDFGTPYAELTRALSIAAGEAMCVVKGFADMTVTEVSEECRLPLEDATLAKARCYDEPFLLLEGDVLALRTAVEKRGMKLTHGGRFFHITGPQDKAHAVLTLINAYRQVGSLETIGFGNGLNDLRFLQLVDHPFLMDSFFAQELHKHIPHACIAASGPAGWSEAIFKLLSTLDKNVRNEWIAS
jgi:mannosyl-3-phosphoglycerate phosphatase